MRWREVRRNLAMGPGTRRNFNRLNFQRGTLGRTKRVRICVEGRRCVEGRTERGGICVEGRTEQVYRRQFSGAVISFFALKLPGQRAAPAR